ncbi:MAG TPA: hypothetical protein VJ654_18605 [Noviherbaspirillum sp.]|nr:hypothetical protein [Noviherbaspirillum sp.]
MTEKAEWELVDAPLPGTRPTLREVLRALLGRHWGWKLFGAAIIASLALTLMLMLTGMAVLLVTATALLSLGIGKLRQWLGRRQRSIMR